MIPITPISIGSINLAMAVFGTIGLAVGALNNEMHLLRRIGVGVFGLLLLFVVLFAGPDPLAYRLFEGRCVNGLCPGM